MEDLRLSVSKTKTFEDCKKKFQFSYIHKLPKKEFEYHTFGKFCHKVLEDFHRAYLNGSIEPLNKEMSKAFKAAQVEYKEKMTPGMVKECFQLIHQYLQILFENKNNNISIDILDVEKPFSFHINDYVILNGVIDRVQIDPDGVLHIADYKSTKNKKYLKDDWFQLLTYCYIMITENPEIKKIRASYILLRHDFEYITKEFDVPEILTIKDKYIKYAEDILSETEFAPNPTYLCNFCEFLDLCDAGKQKVKPSTTFGEVNW